MLQCMLKYQGELMKFPLRVSPSKEMGDRTKQRKNFDRLLLYRLSYEARPEQDVGDYGGNCGNVNVKGTIECFSAST